MEEWFGNGDSHLFRNVRAIDIQAMDFESPPEQAAMENRFLESLNSDTISKDFLELHGQGAETALLANHQAILAYFRHKTLMSERRKQYERMRRAVAVLGDQDAVNELAQDKRDPHDDPDNGSVP